MKQYNHFINGEYKPSVHGGTMGIINPATGKQYALLASGDESDVNLAFIAARNASSAWANTPLADSQDVRYRIANVI